MSAHEKCQTLKAKVVDGHAYYVCQECGKLWEQIASGAFKLVGEVFTEELSE